MQALSDDDIRSVFPDISIVPYNSLKHISDINQILGKDPIFLFYDHNGTNYGHWTLLFRNKQGINFFDSYGGKPDDFDNRVPDLVRLLHDSKEPVNYNEFPYQQLNTEVCGRYCIIRACFKDYTDRRFRNLFNALLKVTNFKTYDDLSIFLTKEFFQ